MQHKESKYTRHLWCTSCYFYTSLTSFTLVFSFDLYYILINTYYFILNSFLLEFNLYCVLYHYHSFERRSWSPLQYIVLYDMKNIKTKNMKYIFENFLYNLKCANILSYIAFFNLRKRKKKSIYIYIIYIYIDIYRDMSLYRFERCILLSYSKTWLFISLLCWWHSTLPLISSWWSDDSSSHLSMSNRYFLLDEGPITFNST